MKKSLGFYYALASAVLATVGLVMYFVYTGNGGTSSTLVIAATIAAIICEVSLLFGEKVYTDFVGIIGAALLAWAMMVTLNGGLGNIADQVNSIVMFGNAELANMNYMMVIVSLLSIVASIGACFSKKSK